MSAREVLAELALRGRQAWAKDPAADAPVHRVMSVQPGPEVRLACGAVRTHGVSDAVGRFEGHLFWCAGCWAGGPS
ncbi:hypothetical protein [Micromonospora sp. NPDC047730]|uniref:hypothetical protein n=1 Tax=Micromonospora sp. NPDC047730 TaxID=3364253 RepID=UPI003719867E